MLHYELHDYHAMIQEEVKEGIEFFRCISVTDYPPGKALYMNFVGYHPAASSDPLFRIASFILQHQNLK